MAIISIDNNRAYNLYKNLCVEYFGSKKLDESIVVVQHIVPNTQPFLKALGEHFQNVVVVPKPNSKNPSALDSLEADPNSNIKIVNAKRENTRDWKFFIDRILPLTLEKHFHIIDIGGYFADSFHEISVESKFKLLGIVEDTENGHQKYEYNLKILASSERQIPIFSVARSPLKEPEDHLVGQSIAYSIERILRDNNSLLTNKKVLIVGYGKIGKSIASSLSSKNVDVWIFDKDPIRKAQALSHGYHTPDRNDALKIADIVVGATGNHSMVYVKDGNDCDFKKLKENCFVASVTSSDDEFVLGTMASDYIASSDGNGLLTFRRSDNNFIFHLLNNGNAVNFTHNNALGPYIYMVGCELLACVSEIRNEKARTKGEVDNLKIYELKHEFRQEIAKKWIDVFSDGGGH
jgi:adenosylhomocysteinase